MKDTFKSLNNFLTILQKKKIKVLLFYFQFIYNLLEMLSLGILFPFLSLIIDPQFISKINSYDIKFVNQLSYNEVLILLLILLVILFILKNIIIGFLSWDQIKYSMYLQNNVATSLLKKYIFNNYLFHKANDSSKLIRVINVDSFVVITGLLFPHFSFLQNYLFFRNYPSLSFL